MRGTLPPLPPTIRLLTEAEADRLDRQMPGVPSPDNCITCGGKRQFRWWNDDRSEIIDWDCECEEQWILHRYLLHCGIGTSYQRLGWADLTDIEPGALALAREYLSNPGYVQQGMGLVLHGEMGTGKTSLLTLIQRRLAVEGLDVFHATFSSMIDMFASSWHDNDAKTWFYRRVKNAGSLSLDDVGREMKGRTNISEAVADEIIRHRVAAAKPSMVSMNLSLKQLEQSYGPNVFSLLSEASATYEFVAQDMRTKQRMRRIDEIRQGLTRPLVLG